MKNSDMLKWIIHSLLAVTLGMTVFAKTLHVGEGFSYSSVRSALDAAKNTDTIIVHKGRYAEGQLLIQKQVVLIGVDSPVIDGLTTSEIWRIEASFVTVRGFVFVRAGISYTQENAAVKVNDARFVTIEDNRFEKNFFAIYLAKSSFCVVRNNFISSDGKSESSSGNGIHLWYCRAITIENNSIYGHRDGIYFEFVKSSIIRNNHSLGNLRYGLHFMFSDSCTYTGNTFEENSAGVAVMYTRYIAMYGNTFRRNWGPASYGILLKDITDSD
ncbi:MAG TPA: NosD domain-containing protein, partial [bacterium]|nr:NosD domain-containing protein [bacterium]